MCLDGFARLSSMYSQIRIGEGIINRNKNRSVTINTEATAAAANASIYEDHIGTYTSRLSGKGCEGSGVRMYVCSFSSPFHV